MTPWSWRLRHPRSVVRPESKVARRRSIVATTSVLMVGTLSALTSERQGRSGALRRRAAQPSWVWQPGSTGLPAKRSAVHCSRGSSIGEPFSTMVKWVIFGSR